MTVRCLIPIAGALMLAAPAAAQTSPSPARTTPAPATGYGPAIKAEQAQTLLARGVREAAARGLKMAIAIVEPSGELVAFVRMDDAPYASSSVAQQKARTAARFRLPTAQLDERVQGGRVALLSSDEVIAIAGGIPIVVDAKVIGAIGISGGTDTDDAAVAASAIDRK